MNTTSNLFQGFEDEVVASTQLPFCQVQNPPNMSLAQIKQFNPPIGWFIPSEQAEVAEFNASNDWQPTRIVFGEDSPNPREVDGFLANHIRIVVLHSSNIEVQEKAKKGWRYLGQAYQYGQLTNHGELAQSDRSFYRLRTRYLVLFLDQGNQPLHHIPFKIGMNAGVGAAFSTEVKEFRDEIETVYFKSVGQPKKSLSHKAHALTVLDIQFGCHKSEGKAPYLYPAVRLAPGDNEIGSEKIVQRRDRTVKLLTRRIESLIIPKKSDTGQTILSLTEEYKDILVRNQDEVASELPDDSDF